MKRLPEVKWNGILNAKGSRMVGEALPFIREYEKNGRVIKVYASCASPDLAGENSGTVRSTAAPKIFYPST